jgi:hypothetical protein
MAERLWAILGCKPLTNCSRYALPKRRKLIMFDPNNRISVVFFALVFGLALGPVAGFGADVQSAELAAVRALAADRLEALSVVNSPTFRAGGIGGAGAMRSCSVYIFRFF